MEDTLDIEVTGKVKKRPSLLTVLCILTFIVSGYNFIFSLWGLFQSKPFDAAGMEQGMRQLNEAAQSADGPLRNFLMNVVDGLSATIKAGVEHATALGITEIVVAGLSILGAYLMLRLQKNGFYTYVIAKIIGIVVPLTLLGFNILTGMMYGLAAVVGAVFVILYGLNRKYMD